MRPAIGHVLIVDDDAPVRRLLHKWVDADGAHAVQASSAEQALLLASQDPPAVVLCDVNMPRGQNGFWFVEQLRRLHPQTVSVMTTAVHDFDAAVTGIRAGVADYVVKPLSRDRISEALARAVAEHQVRLAAVGRQVNARRHVATALVTLLAAQDPETALHADRTSRTASAIAAAVGVSEPQQADIRLATLLRAVTREDVLSVARTSAYLATAYAIANATDERFDGSGSPLGLKGAAIPVGARVLAVAEAFEELVGGASDAPMTPESAVRVLHGRADHFDPFVLRALEAVPAGTLG